VKFFSFCGAAFWGSIALLASATGRAVADPVDSADYFPLDPGTTWTYDLGGVSAVRQVLSPSPPESSQRILATTSGPGAGEQKTYELGPSGILQLQLVSPPPDSTVIVFTPPLVLLPASVDVGSNGSQSGTVSIGSSGSGTYSYGWQVNSIGPGPTPLGPACDVLELSRALSITAFGDTTTDSGVARWVRGVGSVRGSGDIDGVPYLETLTASSLPFPLEAGDPDCDGVPDDGDGSGTAGDHFCVGSVVPPCDDNCPNAVNPDQSDQGGLLSDLPNGRGDACECGDGSDDGRVDGVDWVWLARSLASLPPALAAPEKCQVLAEGPCDGLHLLQLRRALAGDPSSPIIPGCPAFTGISGP